MTRKRAVIGVFCLAISVIIFCYYIWGMLLTEAVEGMFIATDMPFEESSNYLGYILPLASLLFLAIAFWLLLGPFLRKVFSDRRGDGRGE